MPIPLLADFAVRMGGGLAVLLLLASWRSIPLAFFRTHCQVIMGLLVVAALTLASASAPTTPLCVTIAGAFAAYLASVSWGLGLPRLGVPATATIALSCATLLIAAERSNTPALWGLNAGSSLVSALLMGSTATAMLLGHHYLTAPAMSIRPLMRFVRWMIGSLAARALLAAVGLAVWMRAAPSTGGAGSTVLIFLVMRWGMGLVAPAAVSYMTYETVRIRSTQSATGILYIGMTLVLFGELTAMILSRDSGLAF